MSESSPKRIVLEERCGIGTVAVLREQIAKTLEQSAECVIACAAVRTIDTAVLQLLVAAKRTADSTARQLSFEQPSAELLQAAELLGLRAYFA
jgi:anti-anti-sigma regulatory factor